MGAPSAEPPERLPPGDGGGWPPLDLRIPDDISELADDVEAYHRERAAALKAGQHRLWRDRFLLRRYGVSSVLVVAALLLVTAFGGLLTLLGPRTRPGLRPGPLNPSPAAAPGHVGGLLPAADLRINGTPFDVTRMRPGLVLLVPLPCDCAGILHDTVVTAATEQMPVWLVFPHDGRDRQHLSEDVGAASGDEAGSLIDTTSALFTTYDAGPVRPTALAVRADGTLAAPPTLLDDARPVDALLRAVTSTEPAGPASAGPAVGSQRTGAPASAATASARR